MIMAAENVQVGYAQNKACAKAQYRVDAIHTTMIDQVMAKHNACFPYYMARPILGTCFYTAHAELGSRLW